MKSIDVHDLPESMARAIAEQVQHLREQLNKRTVAPSEALPKLQLGAKGSLRREEIYDYLDERP